MKLLDILLVILAVGAAAAFSILRISRKTRKAKPDCCEGECPGCEERYKGSCCG